MQEPGKAHAAADGEKREHMGGEDDPADHQADHGQEHQQVDDQLKGPGRGVFPLED